MMQPGQPPPRGMGHGQPRPGQGQPGQPGGPPGQGGSDILARVQAASGDELAVLVQGLVEEMHAALQSVQGDPQIATLVQQAEQAAEQVQAALGAGDENAAKMAAQGLAQLCTQVHEATGGPAGQAPPGAGGAPGQPGGKPSGLGAWAKRMTSKGSAY